MAHSQLTVAHQSGHQPFRPREAGFTLSEHARKQLAAAGVMTATHLASQVEGKAYAILLDERSSDADRAWSTRRGIRLSQTTSHRHVLIWSVADQALRVVVYAAAFREAALVLAQDTAAYAVYLPLITADVIELAQLQAVRHADGMPVPPYQVLVSWLSPTGAPRRYTFKLATLVGDEAAMCPLDHRDALACEAQRIANGGSDIRVTVRSARAKNRIAMEFHLETCPTISQMRWLKADNDALA